MKNFIEVVDREGKKHLINIQHIYLDVVNNGETQDYYVINEPYEVIKKLIEKKGGEE